ncbi:hypothetical protein Ddye_028311 [Dipteronia dyeriana]|uniref:Uncharacterized protein n=1 Tax=Dipteronia dyeriana TaxID=168575 RepID=A0AAD9WRA4_9ROSI|nr:hypothetical protein Ddye_028311 [Dipteronia dyeriana]
MPNRRRRETGADIEKTTKEKPPVKEEPLVEEEPEVEETDFHSVQANTHISRETSAVIFRFAEDLYIQILEKKNEKNNNLSHQQFTRSEWVGISGTEIKPIQAG